MERGWGKSYSLLQLGGGVRYSGGPADLHGIMVRTLCVGDDGRDTGGWRTGGTQVGVDADGGCPVVGRCVGMALCITLLGWGGGEDGVNSGESEGGVGDGRTVIKSGE